LEVIYNRIVELDSIEHDKTLKKAEKLAKEKLDKFDFGGFD